MEIYVRWFILRFWCRNAYFLEFYMWEISVRVGKDHIQSIFKEGKFLSLFLFFFLKLLQVLLSSFSCNFGWRSNCQMGVTRSRRLSPSLSCPNIWLIVQNLLTLNHKASAESPEMRKLSSNMWTLTFQEANGSFRTPAGESALQNSIVTKGAHSNRNTLGKMKAECSCQQNQ